MDHELKCWPEFWEAVNSGAKPFEIRIADRPFQVGDTLVLNEYDPTGAGYTGRVTRKRVTYLTKWRQVAGYVVMGIEAPSNQQALADRDHAREEREKLQAEVASIRESFSERVAQLTAHRACHSAEHDPLHGRIHGCCVVCGVPWPCEVAK